MAQGLWDPPAASPLTWRQRIADFLSTKPDPELIAVVESGNDWTISLGAAHLLTGLIRLSRARSIVEFGAGRSSLVIARALQSDGGGRLTSIEHQPEYAVDSWRGITRYRSVDAVLVPAALRLRASRHGLLHEYVGIRPTLASRGPFDLVLIDAPPGHLGREAPLFAAAPFLTRDAIVMLDDAARPGEQTTLRRWARGLRVQTIFESPEVGHGVAVLVIAEPARASFAWRTFLGTCHDRYVAWRARR